MLESQTLFKPLLQLLESQTLFKPLLQSEHTLTRLSSRIYNQRGVNPCSPKYLFKSNVSVF
jgi:hypothetical protein